MNRQRVTVVAGPILGLLIFIIGVVTILPASGQETPPAQPQQERPREPQVTVTGGPEVVQVGMYLNQLLNVDLDRNTFDADFYLWFRWRGKIDPSLTYDFLNQTNAWAAKKVPTYPEPITDATGLKYQSWHIQTSFVQSLDFTNYPQSGHTLNMLLEDNTYTATELRYEIDQQFKSNPDASKVLGGWTVSDPQASVAPHVYDSNFGDPTLTAPVAFSQADFSLQIARSESARVIKAILPIGIIIAITLLAFMISSRNIDARLLLTVTAMISAVLLHDSGVSELPPVGYFVSLDKVYLLSYAIVFLTLLESCVGFRLTERGEAAKAAKLDKWAAPALAAIFVIGTLLLILIN